MDMPSQKIRIYNLKAVIEKNFSGDYKLVAEKIGKSELTLRKYLTPSARRPISDKVAREIEQGLDLPVNHLDTGEREGNQIFYVLLKVEYYAPEILEWIYDTFPEVMECAAVYSAWDIFLKISVPSTRHLEVVFGKLIRHPKIKMTKTLVPVENMRWQRAQEHIRLVENPYADEAHSFVEKEKLRRIKSLLYEINMIEKGKYLPINEQEAEHIPPVKIMENTKFKFWSTRAYKERIQNYKAYIKLEEKNVQNGVDIRRILLAPIEEDKSARSKAILQELLKDALEIQKLGSEVKILPEYRWIVNKHMIDPVSFAVIDDVYIYERNPQRKQARLIDDEYDVEQYQELFLINWGAGFTIEKIQDILSTWPEAPGQ